MLYCNTVTHINFYFFDFLTGLINCRSDETVCYAMLMYYNMRMVRASGRPASGQRTPCLQVYNRLPYHTLILYLIYLIILMLGNWGRQDAIEISIVGRSFIIYYHIFIFFKVTPL